MIFIDSRDVKEKAWILPLLGGIFTILAAFTPASFINSPLIGVNMYTWMWGYTLGNGSIFNTINGWIQEPIALTTGIICSIFIFIGGIIMIISANNVKNKKSEGAVSIWLGSGIVTITAALIWINIIELSFQFLMEVEITPIIPYYPVSYTYWAINIQGFGITGVFLGSILSFIGYIVFKVTPIEKERDTLIEWQEPKVFREMKIVEPRPDYTTPHIKFCWNCGNEVKDSKLNYCINCKTKFK